MAVTTEQSSALQVTAVEPIIQKVAWRLIPFLCLLYFVAFLDRVNVSFAALTMNADLGLSASAYGLGAGIFFLGYFLFEIPSNFALKKIGARRWIARIMVSWGLISIAMAFVQGPVSFWVLRFLLGVAEAGFFPGIILYLTFWFPNRVRAAMVGFFLLANPLSTVIGAPLSTLLLETQILNLSGWQTMFIVEGLPAILLGFVVLRCLPDSPAHAAWLSREESATLAAAIEREQAPHQHHSFADALKSSKVWLLALIYFGINLGVYGFGFWAPQIIRSLGGFTNTQTGLMTMIPYVCAAFAMFLWGRHSDRTGERTWHLVLGALVGAIGFWIGGSTTDVATAIGGFALGAAGLYAALPVFWTVPTAILTGTAAAGGIALINSIGTLSGYVGPVVLGKLKEATLDHSGGLKVLTAGLIISAVLALVVGRRT